MTAKTTQPDDLNHRRTRGAILANMRRREQNAADLLVERGWTVVSPYDGSVRPEGATVPTQ